MEALVRVVDAGSFSAAARRWGLSKAVVSKYVAGLEEHLGVALLRRSTRSLSLTEAGRTYHRRCRDLLDELDLLEAELRDDTHALRGTLRVTAPPGLAAVHLDALTTSFVDKHPEVVIDLDLTYRMVDLVEAGIDVAIRLTSMLDSSLIARHLAAAPVVAVASPEYLDDHGMPESPAALRGHQCLVDTNFRQQQRWRFGVDGRTTTVTVGGSFRANSPIAVRDLALAGRGIALIPRLLISEELSDGRLREVLPGTVDLDWSVFAVYPSRQHLAARVRVYIDHLADVFAAEGAT